MSRLVYRLCITILLLYVMMTPMVIYGSTSSNRPSYTEQIAPGTSYEYTGWYVNLTKVSLSFSITIDAVFDDYVTMSIQNYGAMIPNNVSNYIIDVVVLHRMDVINLPAYVGISHTSWSRNELAQMIDSNGTRAYNRDNGMLILMDVNVTNIWVLVMSDTVMMSYDSLDNIIFIGLITIVCVIITLIVYALYIYPRIHRYQQKKREVMIGATRKKKTTTNDKPKK